MLTKEEIQKHRKDKGHNNLIDDLNALLDEASELEFHDFGNEKYAFPKIELRTKLLKMATNIAEGRYDN